jgi:hypothetical protein
MASTNSGRLNCLFLKYIKNSLSIMAGVKYEVAKAHREGRGIVCINMTGMKNMQSQVDPPGPSPLETVRDSNGRTLASLGKYKTYSWLGDLGRTNVDKWIEEAAVNAGR